MQFRFITRRYCIFMIKCVSGILIGIRRATDSSLWLYSKLGWTAIEFQWWLRWISVNFLNEICHLCLLTNCSEIRKLLELVRWSKYSVREYIRTRSPHIITWISSSLFGMVRYLRAIPTTLLMSAPCKGLGSPLYLLDQFYSQTWIEKSMSDDVIVSMEDVNSSPPSAAYMRQRIGLALVQIMACRLFGAKPLPEPMLAYCHLRLRTNTKLRFIKLVLTSPDRFECLKFADSADKYGRHIFSVTQLVFMATQQWRARLRWVAIVMAPWLQSAPIVHIKSLWKLY